MNRGRRREVVFAGEDDYSSFIRLLQKSVELWGVRIAAYCLMPNHYHILVQTPRANLPRFMRHVDGVYTQRFNRRYRVDGSLFRGRYKSVLIDAQGYLLEVLRYIHRNPHKAGLEKHLDRYPWSSHRGYLSSAKKWSWLHKDFLLSLLVRKKDARRKAYLDFMKEEVPDEIRRFYTGKRILSVLGSSGFIQWLMDAFDDMLFHDEIPEARMFIPDLEEIVEAVCEAYGVGEKEILLSRRGIVNEPRNAAIFLSKKLSGLPLTRIGTRFGLKRHSSVRNAVERFERRLTKEARLRKKMQSIEKEIQKGQGST